MKTEIFTKPWFWITIILIGVVLFVIYQLNKIPNSFEVTTTSLLGFGSTTTRYEKRDGKYYKKITASFAGNQALVGVETEITEDEYKTAYKQYSLV